MINKAKVITSAFLNYDVNDKEMCVAHINGDKYDNRVENLKEIYHHQITWFRKNVKGYYYNKNAKKYEAKIEVGGDRIQLGYFKNESDAKNAYLYAKGIVHSN